MLMRPHDGMMIKKQSVAHNRAAPDPCTATCPGNQSVMDKVNPLHKHARRCHCLPLGPGSAGAQGGGEGHETSELPRLLGTQIHKAEFDMVQNSAASGIFRM